MPRLLESGRLSDLSLDAVAFKAIINITFASSFAIVIIIAKDIGHSFFGDALFFLFLTILSILEWFESMHLSFLAFFFSKIIYQTDYTQMDALLEIGLSL